MRKNATQRTIEEIVTTPMYYEQRMKQLLPQLSGVQLLWLWLWLNGYSHAEIAERFDFTRQASSEILKAIKRKAAK